MNIEMGGEQLILTLFTAEIISQNGVILTFSCPILMYRRELQDKQELGFRQKRDAMAEDEG